MSTGGEDPRLLDSAAFYDRVAEVYDQRYGLSRFQTVQQVAWLSRMCRPGPLLDLGCGTGRMLTPLLKAGFSPVGVDASAGMLALAKKALPRVPLVRADASIGLPFADAEFATVISLHSSVIHVTEEEALNRLAHEAWRVLEPEGSFVVELPHPFSYPPSFTGGEWVTFDDGLSCRCLEDRIHELRLSDFHGLRTKVRLITVEDLRTWLKDFSGLELHPGFTGGRFNPKKGHLMVVRAIK